MNQFSDLGSSPASCIISARTLEVMDVISDGLHTTVLPVIKAGANLNVRRYKGRFHGTINPATPTGSLTV